VTGLEEFLVFSRQPESSKIQHLIGAIFPRTFVTAVLACLFLVVPAIAGPAPLAAPNAVRTTNIASVDTFAAISTDSGACPAANDRFFGPAVKLAATGSLPIKTTPSTSQTPSFTDQSQLRGPQSQAPITLPDSTMRGAVQKLKWDSGEAPVPTSPGLRNDQTQSPSAPAEQEIDHATEAGTPLKVRIVLNESLLNSPRVAAIRAQLGIQKALYAAATQMPDPVLFRDEGALAEGVRRIGPQVTYEPPWKLAFRLLAAKNQVQETKQEILNTLWQFRNDVRRGYTEVVVAQETYDTLHDLANLARRLQDVSQKRFQAGDVPELDVLKARLATSQADIDSAQGGMRVTRSRQQLNVIMGRQFSQPISAPRLPAFESKQEQSELLPDYRIPVPPVTDFIAEAMENRLDLKINTAQIKLTKSQLMNAAGNIIPNPILAYGSSTETNLPSGPKLNGLFVTLNAEVPLYTFSQGDIARLKATMRQFHLQSSAIRNQIVADVTSAYNNLVTARNRIRTYQDHVLADSAEVARLARRSYEVGQSDITATLAAQQANFQVRQAYLDAVSAYQASYTDLEQAIGEPIE
jgi:outer membrane protein, heavy metal efflux system